MRVIGTVTAIVVVAAAVVTASAAGAAAGEGVSPAQAQAAFERLKQLKGAWEARSTKGWEGVHDMRLIARGSALLSTSTIDPHPGADESMATVFHLDGGRLLVTHYCVAGNQPRLVATRIDDDGKRIEFELLDATNMPSPQAGHMHRAVFTIHSTDRYESRWTFSRDGHEAWMENIVNTRRDTKSP